MEILKYILVGIDVLVCLGLIIMVLRQNNNDTGASGTIVGNTSSNNFYEKNKGRTKEGKMKRTTIILMVLFVILTIALSIVYVA
ncbi:MAG: preprotein translocase subunit SecG [Clostridia bacterium]|nr:preprotein translocase subunit SecG [Clostridia bacterium]